jgi:putative ABC transport system ATP-binding protein
MTTTAVLDARQVSRRHPDGRQWLLEDVSLTVHAGERIALVGPSGSGKTLALRALVLLDPLDSGEIRWQGRVVRREMIPAFRARAIYLHQRPAFSRDTVEAVLRRPFALRAHRARRFDRDWVLDHLKHLGRDASFLEKRIRDLSGGEMQITALLRALELEPGMLLLDEPTAALDTQTAAAAEEMISGWVDDAPDRRAFLWVGHDQTQARRVTERSAAIHNGRLTDGPW